MALSWTGAVALANRIAGDVPAVKTMLDALAKMDFTGITSIPANVKRIASVTGGVQLQKYASNAWSSIGKLMHDVDTVDGFHAGTGTTKNTIPVRDTNGALPGNITGNAATATSAQALSQVNPIAKGGTGASTAAEARKNLGVVTATISAQGLVRPDGQTILADATGTLTVKNVAIDGDVADLASERGRIGDYAYGGSFDFSQEKTEASDVFIDNGGSTNRPFAGPFAVNVKIRQGDTQRRWLGYFLQSVGRAAAPQAAIKSSYRTDGNSPYQSTGWSILLDDKHVGDGITVNNGIISVPEYSGATASAPGTSGLVPPAAAGEQSKALTGSGDWVEMLSTSGGIVVGSVGINGLLLVSKHPGDTSGEGGEIHLEPGSNGSYPAIIDTTANRIRFFGKPGIPPVEVDLESGKFVGDIVGKATGLGTKEFVDARVSGTPLWLLGLHSDGKLRPFNKSDIQAGYADSAGKANLQNPAVFHVASDMSGNFQGIPLPAGGTWRYAGTYQQGSSSYFSSSFAGDAAGGTKLNISGRYYSLIAVRIA